MELLGPKSTVKQISPHADAVCSVRNHGQYTMHLQFKPHLRSAQLSSCFKAALPPTAHAVPLPLLPHVPYVSISQWTVYEMKDQEFGRFCRLDHPH